MTTMQPHTNNQQPHVFYNGTFTSSEMLWNDWANIERDITGLRWEDLLFILLDEHHDFPDTFTWG
jgi:hypothetical protein